MFIKIMRSGGQIAGYETDRYIISKDIHSITIDPDNEKNYTFPLDRGDEVFIMNERGMTVDRYIG